ncbi:Multiple organellar rna editing factor 8 protein [Thalictrum thalictroides]|uniref:Multiple organellar rna editing factor 8 protein n=1 Tax=Thalictrum thalictroides TaxID=46969 RepID=A0A7J6W208_THATH|nr:Multiple organellar rna editing factor 8 protein [Thalictrum thalictroides]
MSFLGRTLIPKSNSNHLLPSIISRSFFVKSNSVPHFVHSYSTSSSFLSRVSRPLSSLTNTSSDVSRFPSMVGLRCLSTRASTSSLNDPSPNWNNRPPKETILLDGCDFEHWLVVVEKPEGEPTRDEIIDSYIKTLAQVVGGEEEARMKIYSVSTRHYFAFGALVSEELSYKIKELPRVRWVLPDSYLDVRNKDYGGEPFINGQAVPYDPKYHEEWVRNNARAQDRSRRNDRPRNFDRSRNFERRRENMQNRDAQPPMQNSGANMGGPPGPNMQHPGPSMQHPGPNMGGPPNANMQHPGPNMGGPPNANMQHPGPNMGGPPNANMQHPGPNMGVPTNANMQNSVPNYAGVPSRDAGPNAAYSNNVNMGNRMPNYGPPRDAGPAAGYTNMNGMPNRDAGPAAGYTNMNGMPNRDAGPSNGYPNSVPQYRDAPNNGGIPHQSRDAPGPMPNRDYQNSYTPTSNMGGLPSNNAYQVREMPGRDMPSMPNQNNYH